MGRYNSFGIAVSYSISFAAIDKAIRRDIWGKGLQDYRENILRIFSSQFPDVYDGQENEYGLEFRLRDSVSMAEVVGLAQKFFNILPYKVADDTPEVLEKFRKMSSIDNALNNLRSEGSYNFQPLSLYPYLYGMNFVVDGKKLYVNTGVEGFCLYSSSAKTITEDDISFYDFVTELLRYRLKEDPLSQTLLSYLSE